MPIGFLLIMYLLTLWLVAMVVLWHGLRGPETAATPATERRFALREGQTILGVMDTTEMMCFCLGEIEAQVQDEEDTAK